MTPDPSVRELLAGIHVLIVGSDATTRELLEALLAYCGALVINSPSVREAIRLASRQTPDVVVAALAPATARELLDQLRDAGRGRSVPVLALVRAGEEATSVGFDAQVRIPAVPWTLCRRLADLVRRP